MEKNKSHSSFIQRVGSGPKSKHMRATQWAVVGETEERNPPVRVIIHAQIKWKIVLIAFFFLSFNVHVVVVFISVV